MNVESAYFKRSERQVRAFHKCISSAKPFGLVARFAFRAAKAHHDFQMTHAEHPHNTDLLIRPFQNADAEAVAALVTAGVRSHWTYRAEQFKASDNPQRRRMVGVTRGQVVATAHFVPFGDAAPDALRLDFAGDGDTFTPLYLALLAELPAGFTRLLGVTREDFSEKMQFYAAAGFRNAYQSWGAHLDLAHFDFEQYRPLEEKLFLAGYEIEMLGASDADWDAFYALHQDGERDTPRNPVTTPDHLSSTDLRAMIEREERAFVARYRGEIVALTRLTLGLKKGRGPEVESKFTTTHPAHCSRGLATLLKAHALAWAKAQGYKCAGTGGTVLNLPMLRVNTRLGYLVERMWVTWERGL